jgi:DNA replication and repair protein RecF
VRATRVELRDFRNYERAQIDLDPRLTVVAGPNGAGKTNLLEAVYFGCTARSPRTANERELVRKGAPVTRVSLATEGEDGEHSIEVGFEPGEPKRVRVDGAAVDSLSTSPARPLVVVFLPDRLELVKGAPSGRRAHLDQLVAALWPTRVETRSAYSRALAQRNALLARIRARAASPDALDAWDAELARRGAQLMEDRTEAADLLVPAFADAAEALGLPEPAEVRYRPRSRAEDADGLAAELRERRAADLERGFTAHGPHRDELDLRHGGEPLRGYGSQGQQRTALLALLFGERELLVARHREPPLMLLDDVMSELDEARRERLAELLGAGGQAIVTTTETAHVPADGARVVEVRAGTIATVAA